MVALVALHTNATWWSDLVSLILRATVDLPDVLMMPFWYMLTTGSGLPPSALQVKVTQLFSCWVSSDGKDVICNVLGASVEKSYHVEDQTGF